MKTQLLLYKLNLNDKTLDFGKQRSTAMKQNKYFCMSGAVNRKDELVLQRLKDKLIQGAKNVIKNNNQMHLHIILIKI